MVYNIIPVNNYTIKSSYLMYKLEKVLDMIINLSYNVYFIIDISNSYWAMPIKENGCNKTGFVTPNSSWVYPCMGQRLKRTSYTYAQFSDLVFETFLAIKDKYIYYLTRYNHWD